VSPESPLPLPRRGFRWAGFADAWRGVCMLLVSQPNARVHLAATLGVVLVGWWFALARWEWVALVGACGLVWVAEAINTAIECAVDLVSPDWHRLAGLAKDAAAGAVLLASVAAVVVGLLLFGPRLLAWWAGPERTPSAEVRIFPASQTPLSAVC
jgi:diacylglycerol kinase